MVGPALCAKLLKRNGQSVYRSSYQHLTEDEVYNPEEVKKRDDFDRRIEIKLGRPNKFLDFDDEGQAPLFQFYEDDNDGVIDHAKEAEEEPTPISFNNYIGTQVTLPRGDEMVSGTMKTQVKDYEGDRICVANQDPIFDTRAYKVEFISSLRWRMDWLVTQTFIWQPRSSKWSYEMGSSKYIEEAMQNCEKYLAHSMNGRKLTQKALNPFPVVDDPDLDMTDGLNDDEKTYFQSQIGILRWMVEWILSLKYLCCPRMLHYTERATWKQSFICTLT